MLNCYFCGEEFTHKNNHFEHIIPQAIGGRLRSENILCLSCGNKLGKEIDKDFVHQFKVLNNFFDVKKDRGGNSKTTFHINIDNINVEVIFKKNIIRINKFIKDEKSKKIYCYSEKDAKISEEDRKCFSIITSINPLEYLDNIYNNIVFDDRSIKKGILKIAVEFAIYCKIDISHLNKSFDIVNRMFLDAEIIDYLPVNIAEGYIDLTLYDVGQEYIRQNDNIQTNQYFPYHMLRLFSFDKKLYCYVNIYSFFECYVLLGDNFEYSINRDYMNTVSKLKNFYYRYELCGYPKSTHLAARHFNVDFGILQSEVERIKSIYTDKRLEFIKKNTPSDKNINITDYFMEVFDKFSHVYYLKSAKLDDKISEKSLECFNYIYEKVKNEDLKKNFFLGLSSLSRNNFSTYKKFYVDSTGEYIDVVTLILEKNIETGSISFKENVMSHRKKLLRNVLISSDLLFNENFKSNEIDGLRKTNIDTIFFRFING